MKEDEKEEKEETKSEPEKAEYVLLQPVILENVVYFTEKNQFK